MGWRIGRSRPSDVWAEEDLNCACGVNVAAQGFRIRATLARNSGLKLGPVLGDVIVLLWGGNGKGD